VYVSGTLGDGALGLACAQGTLVLPAPHGAWLLERYQLPQPRLALGQALVGLAHACMDISDGLVQDMGQLCQASGVGAVLHQAQLPLSHAARAAPPTQALAAALSGGDDYELLFTAPASAHEKIISLTEQLSLPITRIGEVTKGTNVTVLDAHGQPLPLTRTGWVHGV
jgi:thiamine-monophosphate kinase